MVKTKVQLDSILVMEECGIIQWLSFRAFELARKNRCYKATSCLDPFETFAHLTDNRRKKRDDDGHERESQNSFIPARDEMCLGEIIHHCIMVRQTILADYFLQSCKVNIRFVPCARVYSYFLLFNIYGGRVVKSVTKTLALTKQTTSPFYWSFIHRKRNFGSFVNRFLLLNLFVWTNFTLEKEKWSESEDTMKSRVIMKLGCRMTDRYYKMQRDFMSLEYVSGREDGTRLERGKMMQFRG